MAPSGRALARRSAAAKAPPARRGSVTVRADAGPQAQYPNPDYIAHVQSEFPAKGVATAEEGRCLWDAGYDVLDVRAVEEIDQNDSTPCPNPAPPGKGRCFLPTARGFGPSLKKHNPQNQTIPTLHPHTPSPNHRTCTHRGKVEIPPSLPSPTLPPHTLPASPKLSRTSKMRLHAQRFSIYLSFGTLSLVAVVGVTPYVSVRCRAAASRWSL